MFCMKVGQWCWGAWIVRAIEPCLEPQRNEVGLAVVVPSLAKLSGWPIGEVPHSWKGQVPAAAWHCC